MPRSRGALPVITTMKEIWKPIFEGMYAVSNYGRVRGKRTGAVLKPLVSVYGYEKINYHFPGGRRQCYVHDLVAAAFIGPKPARAHVNHKDGVKRNNFAGNLEYTTSRQNTHHAMRMGLLPRGEKHYNAKLTRIDVTQIRAHFRGNADELARMFGVNRCTIHRVVNRHSWKHL